MKSRIVRASLAMSLVTGLALTAVACSDDGGSPQAIPTSESLPSDDTTGELPQPNGEANDRDEFITTTLAQLEQIAVQLRDIEAEVQTMDAEGRAGAEARLDSVKTTIAETQTDLVEVPQLSETDYRELQETIEAEVEAAMTETQELADELGI